jgi:hypothetical protein
MADSWKENFDEREEKKGRERSSLGGAYVTNKHDNFLDLDLEGRFLGRTPRVGVHPHPSIIHRKILF